MTPALLFGFVPRHTITFECGLPAVPVTAYTQFGNGDETRLDYGVSDSGGGSNTASGTRTRDSATDSVSFRFSYADLVGAGLRDGVVLRNIQARATNTGAPGTPSPVSTRPPHRWASPTPSAGNGRSATRKAGPPAAFRVRARREIAAVFGHLFRALRG